MIARLWIATRYTIGIALLRMAKKVIPSHHDFDDVIRHAREQRARIAALGEGAK